MEKTMEDLRVLVIGGTGMLGHKVFQKLSSRIQATSCCVRCSAGEAHRLAPTLLDSEKVIGNTDLTDWEALTLLLKRFQPDVVVNCAGIIKQRFEAHLAVPCIEVNSLLPHRLAAICSEWNARLIHFSTDCVFTGTRGNYTEDDTPDSSDLYGRTKALGEISDSRNVLTLRTSMIGRELSHFHSLLEWFLGQQNGRVRGFTRAIYSGVTTNYLAEIVLRLIVDFPDLHGLYQVVADPISKYELLCRLRDAYGIDIECVADTEFVCDRSMRGEKFQRATGMATPSWDALIAGLVSDGTPYQQWRSGSVRQPECVENRAGVL